MPNEGKDAKSTPDPKGPPTGAANPPAGAQRTLDLKAYRTATGAAAAKDDAKSESAAARNPKVHWSDLAGIDDLKIVDVWRGSTDEFGEYMGAVVKLPKVGNAPSTEVTALANLKTQAGGALAAAEMRGAFDHLGEPGVVGCSVRVRTRKSPNFPDGRPMVLLTIGDA